MNNEYYDLLGLSEDATDEQITEKYRELKKKYNEDRWLEGEAGNEAAKMLNKLDVAYQEIISERREKQRNTGGKSAFEEVEEFLTKGDLASAQNKLDSFNERNGQWHYLQAVVFYKKQWTNESKKQLEIAMQLEPNNQKFKDAYEKFNATQKEGTTNESQNQQKYANNNMSSFAPEDQMGGNGCSECMSWCTTCLCFNLCFNLCCGCN